MAERFVFEVKPGGESFTRMKGNDGSYMRAHRHAARLASERKKLHQVFRASPRSSNEPMSPSQKVMLEAGSGHAAYFDFDVVGWLPLPEEEVSVERRQTETV